MKFIRQVRRLQKKSVAFHGRKRGLDFVGNIAHEIRVQDLGCIKLPDHFVEIAVHLADLGILPLLRQTDVKISICNLVHGAA